MPGAPEWHGASPPPGTPTTAWRSGMPKTRTLLSGDAVLTVGGRAWVTPETVDDAAGAETAERSSVAWTWRTCYPGTAVPSRRRPSPPVPWGPGEGPKGVEAFFARHGPLPGGRRGSPAPRVLVEEVWRPGARRWPRIPRRGPRRASPGSRACACRCCRRPRRGAKARSRGKSSSCHCTRNSSGQRTAAASAAKRSLVGPAIPMRPRTATATRGSAATTGRPKIVPIDRPQ